jgi:para-aminobenzoate synthetase/4-amino-4-deoxychorismate lyase
VTARPFAVALGRGCPPASAPQWLRGLPGAVALSGAWAGGPLILSSHPLRVLAAAADPFAALDELPLPAGALIFEDRAAPRPLVGGGWFGWLGFELAGHIEPLTPPPAGGPRRPPFRLAFHDHLVRADADGVWWFEALWTPERGALLDARLDWWRERLATEPPPAQAFRAGPLAALGAGLSGHRAAVAETIVRIAEGELSQANVCLAFEGAFAGDPLDLWARANDALAPGYAAYLAGEDHAVASLSPELFLRRAGDAVESRPIKGTAPRAENPARLAGSAKDRAENVMIVDLMRNDLGRVCEYGTVAVPELWAVRPAAGVWHLVSTVTGRLRPGTGDGELVRAAFPPGSVTGAPKLRALRVIHELEGSPREVYCGAIGLRSPLSGLELNVAIRTFEVTGGRVRLGAGGGIVSDSSPDGEVAEAIAKARGVATAAGVELQAVGPDPPAPGETLPALRLPRPDPAAGVFETIRVAGGVPRHLAAHLARLRDACVSLGDRASVGGAALESTLLQTARRLGDGALRVEVGPDGIVITTRTLPASDPVRLRPVGLPGGLGARKWADRRLIDELSPPGATPLICELDGTVLEAGYAAVCIVRGGTLTAPPLDGRILPSISRAALLTAAPRAGLEVRLAGFDLAEARAADAILLCSSLRGPHPGLLPGGPGARRAAELCAALEPLVE